MARRVATVVTPFPTAREGENRFRDLANWCEAHLTDEELGRLAALLLGFAHFSDTAVWSFDRALPEFTGTKGCRKVKLPPVGSEPPADLGDWWGR